MNLDRTVRRVRSLANDVDIDDLLETIGLQQRRSAYGALLPAIGILGAGILVGAGLGLLFAPTSGKILRREAEGRVNQLKGKIRPAVHDSVNSVTGALDDAKESINDRFTSTSKSASI
jgi:hypothetical protein